MGPLLDLPTHGLVFVNETHGGAVLLLAVWALLTAVTPVYLTPRRIRRSNERNAR